MCICDLNWGHQAWQRAPLPTEPCLPAPDGFSSSPTAYVIPSLPFLPVPFLLSYFSLSIHPICLSNDGTKHWNRYHWTREESGPGDEPDNAHSCGVYRSGGLCGHVRTIAPSIHPEAAAGPERGSA